MSHVIDRRLNGKNKSTVNRQRFLRRYRDHIKKAVEEAVSRRSITDMEHGEQISIPGRDIDEPVLHHGRGGRQTTVHPGNREFTTGEKIARPQGGGSGQGAGKASNSGEGMDEFVFQITQEEFLDFMFEDLELPNLIKRHLTGSDTFKSVRAGISNEGNPSRINIVRTLRSAHARRIALSGSSRNKLKSAQAELERLKLEQPDNLGDIHALEEEVSKLRARIKRIPFLDTFDLKYNLLVKQPNPSSKAVMFCLMDVSGSMTQATKDIAKRFFILLYLFLKRNYDKIDVVFIRHHTRANRPWPLSRFCRRNAPPCRCAMDRAIDNPRPEPVVFACGPRLKRWPRVACSCSVSPGPLSSTLRLQPSSSPAAASVTVPPDGV